MTRAALLLASTIFALPALAQTAQHQARDRDGTSSVHAQDDEGIVVTAPYVADLDLLAGSSVVTGDTLVRDIRGQIGDTLTRVPGVSATSFTPARRDRSCAVSRASASACCPMALARSTFPTPRPTMPSRSTR